MALRDRFVTLLPGVKLVNLYSISECHDVAVADLSAGELEKVTHVVYSLLTSVFIMEGFYGF